MFKIHTKSHTSWWTSNFRKLCTLHLYNSTNTWPKSFSSWCVQPQNTCFTCDLGQVISNMVMCYSRKYPCSMHNSPPPQCSFTSSTCHPPPWHSTSSPVKYSLILILKICPLTPFSPRKLLWLSMVWVWMAPCEETAKEVSFELPHHRISSRLKN